MAWAVAMVVKVVKVEMSAVEVSAVEVRVEVVESGGPAVATVATAVGWPAGPAYTNTC